MGADEVPGQPVGQSPVRWSNGRRSVWWLCTHYYLRARERAAAAYLELPNYSRAEKVADGIIHALGVTAAPIAVIVLLVLSLPTGETRLIAASAIYGAGMIATFGFSAAYNVATYRACGPGKWPLMLRRFDHAAIYLMIAGTYTPFLLVGLQGHGGQWLLGLVWFVALAGIALKLFWPRRLRTISLVLYLALGWIGIVVAGSIVAALPPVVVVLIAVGGVLYTTGIVFHVWTSLSYQNAIWHAFVLAAAGCHYAAVVETVRLA